MARKILRAKYKGKFAKIEYRQIHRDAKGRFTTKDKAVKTQTIKLYRVKGKYVKSSQIKWYPIRTRAKVIIKRVAVYGTTSEGIKKRYHIHGSGKDLQQAVAIAVKRPPKKRMVKVSAVRLVTFPDDYTDKYDYWDDYDVES